MRSLFGLVVALVISLIQADDCPQGLCSNSETCCHDPSVDQYGCCPKFNAVCCSDGLHCCPTDTVCNLLEGTCDSNNNLIPFIFRKKPKQIVTEGMVATIELQVAEQVDQKPKQTVKEGMVDATELQVAEQVDRAYCPGRRYYCPDRTTCCQRSRHQYRCCPFAQGTCCPDGYHCCPYGQRCDATSTKCYYGNSKYSDLFNRAAEQIVEELKVAATKLQVAENVDVVYCPGGQSYCPDKNTCCFRPSTGQYGCCPFVAATCCSDGFHCCDHGQRCDSTSAYCYKGNKKYPALLQQAANLLV